MEEDEELAKWVAGRLGISLAKLWRGFKTHKKGDNMLFLRTELEVRSAWDPEGGAFSLNYDDCRMKKLIPNKPKYRFESIDLPGKPKSDAASKNPT